MLNSSEAQPCRVKLRRVRHRLESTHECLQVGNGIRAYSMVLLGDSREETKKQIAQSEPSWRSLYATQTLYVQIYNLCLKYASSC